jgi:hypothetical protein
MRLLVRHEWEAAGHNGVDEFGIAEFLAQDGAAAAALIKILFGRVPVECLRDSKARTAPPPPRSFRVGLHHYKLVACSGCIE